MEDEALKELLSYFNLENEPRVGTILAGNQVVDKCTKFFRRICTTTYSDSIQSSKVAERKRARPIASKAKCGLCSSDKFPLQYTLTCCKLKCCVPCSQTLQESHPCFNKHTFCRRCETSQGVEEVMFVTTCCNTSLCTECTTEWYKSHICLITGCDNSKRLIWTKARKPLTILSSSLVSKSVSIPSFLTTAEIERAKHLLDLANNACMLELPLLDPASTARLFAFHYTYVELDKALTSNRPPCASPICMSEHIKGATCRLPILCPPGHLDSVTFTPQSLDFCMICALIRQQTLISKITVDESVFIDPKWYIHITFSENVNLNAIEIRNIAVGLIGYTGMFKPTHHYTYWELLSKLRYENGILNTSALMK